MNRGEAGNPAYRRDIDGLRAIAVLAVIGFHAGVPGLGGGYIGVDIFFVISGFLITQLIVRDLHAGRFSLRHFYERRFRRLMPALTLVLLACLVPAWLWMLPGQLQGFSASVTAVLLLVPNIFFWRNTSYFNPASEDFPLLHTWSLGIEEQFYIVFSLMLLLIWRFGRRHISLALAIACLSSLVLCELVRRSSSIGAFYLLPFRAWELLLGGLAAQWATQWAALVQSGEKAWLRKLLAWLAILTLAISFLAFDRSTPFPGLLTLIPVLATVALLLTGQQNQAVSRALACTPLVGIGLISYSAYLWHYPVFVFAELASLSPPGPWLTAMLIALVLALAALSWRLVEQPARASTVRFGVVAGLVGLATVVIVLFAWQAWRSGGAPSRLPAETLRLLADANSRNPRQAECLDSTDHQRPPGDRCLLGDTRVQPTIALMGDSHANSLFAAMDQQLQRSGKSARFIAFAGCPPVPGLYRIDMRDRHRCNDYFSAAYAQLQAQPELATVIVSARWSTYLEGEAFDNGEGGKEPGKAMVADSFDSSAGRPDDRKARVAAAYKQGIKRLLEMGKQVVLVYPVPEAGWDVPQWLALHQMRGRPIAGDLSTSAAVFEDRNRRSDRAFEDLKAEPGQLIKIRSAALFCNTVQDGRCMAQIDGVAQYSDNNHLNFAGASRVVDAITAALP